MNTIERMQENLKLIRKTVGWSAEEFGKRIGVSKQTINNLEKNSPSYKLNDTIYIAMRCALDNEIQNNEDTKMLSSILEMFVDNPGKYPDKERKELLKKANIIAPSILDKNSTREETSSYWEEVLKISFTALGVAGVSLLSALLSRKTILNESSKWFERYLASTSIKK